MLITRGRYLKAISKPLRTSSSRTTITLGPQEIDTESSREFAALKSNRGSVLDLDSSDAEPLSNFSALGFFLLVDFKLKSPREGVAQQSSQNQMERPPDKAGAGWLFIAASFPDGK